MPAAGEFAPLGAITEEHFDRAFSSNVKGVLARTWTLDLEDRRIRVNAVSPGGSDTSGLHGLAHTQSQVQQLESGLIASILMGRLGTPDEMARPSRFSHRRTAAM